jgi:hypothetical protein
MTMPRLIDADALDDVLREEYLSATDDSMVLTPRGSIIFNAVLDRVRCIAISQPTIDAEPVRHGRWIKFVYDTRWVKCSECECNWERRIVEECNVDYCPNCGAKMDGGAESV